MAQDSIVRSGRHIPCDMPGNTNKRTGTAFTKGQNLLHVSDHMPCRDRRYHFTPTILLQCYIIQRGISQKTFQAVVFIFRRLQSSLLFLQDPYDLFFRKAAAAFHLSVSFLIGLYF